MTSRFAGDSPGARLLSGMTHRRKPMLRFTDTERGVRSRANLAGQADLAGTRRRRRNGAIAETRRDRSHNRRSAAGSSMERPPATFYEYVIGGEVQARAFVEHREQQRQPVLIEAAGRPCADSHERGSAHERLHFDEDRSRALDRHSTAEPGTLAGRSARTSFEGFGTGRSPAPVISNADRAPLRTGSSRPARCGGSDADGPRSTAPCRPHARGPWVRRGCRPW